MLHDPRPHALPLQGGQLGIAEFEIDLHHPAFPIRYPFVEMTESTPDGMQPGEWQHGELTPERDE